MCEASFWHNWLTAINSLLDHNHITMKLSVATCQFPVSADIRQNLAYVVRQVHAAKDLGAHIVHFPEACLSGYAGTDFASHEGFDWSLLKECTEGVLVSTFDTEESWYDSTEAWRDRAMNGVLHSGTLVQDERSAERTRL